MKYIVILVCVVFSGCCLDDWKIVLDIAMSEKVKNEAGFDLTLERFSDEFNDADSVREFVLDNIEYDNNEVWRSPTKAIIYGGNTAEQCFLFIELYYFNFNEQCSIGFVDAFTPIIVFESGKQLDITTNEETVYLFDRLFMFNEIFALLDS